MNKMMKEMKLRVSQASHQKRVGARLELVEGNVEINRIVTLKMLYVLSVTFNMHRI